MAPLATAAAWGRDVLFESAGETERIMIVSAGKQPRPLIPLEGDRALAFVACRAAIKAHAPLQRDEMGRLVSDLSATETPYFCPHGRPIVSRLSLREIKRELGRTW